MEFLSAPPRYNNPNNQQEKGEKQMKLMTLKQTTVEHPAFTMAGLRWQLHRRNTNGLKNATIKIGRRVYIDSDAFCDWLKSNKEN